MRSGILKIFGYIFFRYLAFFATLYITDKNVKMVQWSDLRKGEDWFMLLWLFGLPVLFEFLIIGLPMSYGLNKLPNVSNKTFVYILILILFVIEFLFANWIYGTQSAFIKVGISIILFLVLFWKRLF